MVKLYTDSGCDLDLEVLESMEVTMVPILVTIGDESYEDRKQITPKEFYTMLRENKSLTPKTSQVTPQRFMDAFKEDIDAGNEILYIAFSSGLSGTCQAAMVAKEMLETDKITVVDTKAASVGQAMLLHMAHEQLKEGKAIADIVSFIEDYASKLEHIFAIGELDMLVRGGRLSSTKGAIATLLNIKPILNFIDGRIHQLDKVRSKKKIMAFFEKMIEERAEDLASQPMVGVNYSDDDTLALELKSLLEEKYGVKRIIMSEVGAVIGSHVGAGTTSLFFRGKNLQGDY